MTIAKSGNVNLLQRCESLCTLDEHDRYSLRTIVRANCLSCCGFSVLKIRVCEDTSCDFWNYRMDDKAFSDVKVIPDFVKDLLVPKEVRHDQPHNARKRLHARH